MILNNLTFFGGVFEILEISVSCFTVSGKRLSDRYVSFRINDDYQGKQEGDFAAAR
jgi:hypothetical protein